MSIKYSYIMTECNVDTNVASCLMQGTVSHQHTCNDVAKTLKDKYQNKFGVGIIDKDKKIVPYLREFDEIEHSEHLCVWKHKNLDQYMITVSPAMDGFLWDCAQEHKIPLDKYELPTNRDDFIERMKHKSVYDDPAIKRLTRDMLDNKELGYLKCILQYLSQNTYKSDSKDIKSFFK